MRTQPSFPFEFFERPQGGVGLGSPDADFLAAQRGDPAAQERMRLNRAVLSFYENGGSAADPFAPEVLDLAQRCAQLRAGAPAEPAGVFNSLASRGVFGAIVSQLRKWTPGAARGAE